MNKKKTFIKDVPLTKINTLPQMRKTFDGIPELAENIKERGLIHPITLAKLDKTQAKKYLRFINKVHGKRIPLGKLQTHRNYFYILIAGERRIRACKLLQWKYIKSSVCVGITVEEAIKIQGSENTNFPVPPEEEAIFYERFFKLLSLSTSKEKISYASFSRMVGRSPKIIRDALRFINLPNHMQKAVVDKALPYGIAVQLAKIKDSSCTTDDELEDLFIRSLIGRHTVKSFKKVSESFLLGKESNQLHLLEEIFTKEMLDEERRNARKKSLEKDVSYLFHSSNAYFLRVLYLFERGSLGVEYSPFSLKGPLSSFEKHLNLLKRLLPHLEKVAQSLADEGERVIIETEKRIRKINQYA